MRRLFSRGIRRHIRRPPPIFSTIMTSRHAVIIVIAVALLCGCGDQGKHGTQIEREIHDADVPYLTDEQGVKYPYFKYENYLFFSYDSEHQDGLAMFVHPIFEDRVKGLTLKYLPTQSIRSLFGEELFGGEFFVGSKNGILAIEGLPISLPADMKPGSNWKMNYAEQVFDCLFEPGHGNELMVDCVSSEGSLEFSFNKTRGVTKFQDFCDGRVCTFFLKTDVGLLSPYHRGVIGL